MECGRFCDCIRPIGFTVSLDKPKNRGPVPGLMTTISFFIIFDDVVEYLSIRCAQLKKQGRRTEPILTVG